MRLREGVCVCVCGYVMKYNIKMKSKCYGFKKIIINVKYKKKRER